jgi:hypothetical protein
MTEDLLHSFLRQTENAELPEGEYLKVCNALKKTFEDMNKSSPEYIAKDMKFVLRFDSNDNIECVFTISKYLVIRGPEPNLAVYSLKITSKAGCIIDDVNKKIRTADLSNLVELLLESYHFDTFALETFVGDRLYCVDDVRKEEFNLAKSTFDRGQIDEALDLPDPLLEDRLEITFIKRILQKSINLSAQY